MLRFFSESVEHPMTGVDYPGKNDVMLGRGGESNYHSGNVHFRQFAQTFRERYKKASRQDKPTVATELVLAWRGLDPPGRFLARTDPSRSDSCWHDVGDDIAVRRATKTLGEKTQKERRAQKVKKEGRRTSGSKPSSSASSKFSRGTSSGDSCGSDESGQIIGACSSDRMSPHQPLQREYNDSYPPQNSRLIHSGFRPGTGRTQRQSPMRETGREEEADKKPAAMESTEETLDTPPGFYANLGVEKQQADIIMQSLPTAAELTNTVFSDSNAEHQTEAKEEDLGLRDVFDDRSWMF